MSFWTADNLQKVTSGRWIMRADAPRTTEHLSGLSIDSRTITRGQVFCAVRGERFDGHNFVAQAVDAGSPLLIVEREEAMAGVPRGIAGALLVDSTIASLGRLAAAYRKTLTTKVIAVTGSAGKTTTKQMIHAVLGTQLTGKASPKSFNNHIGVPLTLLSVEPKDRYVICEVGTNAPGEIAALGRIVEPDIAIITHVGLAHIERLGTLEDVAREKAALLSSLREGGLGIVNGDIEPLRPHLKVAPTLITFGKGEDCDLRLTDYRPTPTGCRFEINRRVSFELPMLGEHNAINALAAVAVGRHMNLSDQTITEGLAAAVPPDMRLNVWTLGTEPAITLINDAYNANPDSMLAALSVLAGYPASGRRIAVLGDMLELGQQTPELHRLVGQRAAECGIDAAVFIGRASLFAAEAAGRAWEADRIHTIATWTDTTPQDVAALIEPGDVVLIKASRAMGLERLIPAIQQKVV